LPHHVFDDGNEPADLLSIPAIFVIKSKKFTFYIFYWNNDIFIISRKILFCQYIICYMNCVFIP